MQFASPHRSYVTPQSLKQITVLALPLMGSQLASIGIMTSDIIMMGALSAFDLGAGSLAIRFYQPFYFFALGLTAVIALSSLRPLAVMISKEQDAFSGKALSSLSYYLPSQARLLWLARQF